jgi:hypothetical protein
MYIQYNNSRLTWIFYRIIQQAGVQMNTPHKNTYPSRVYLFNVTAGC